MFVPDRTRRVVDRAVEERVEVQSFLQRCKVNAQDADGLGADTGREEEQQLVLAPVI
jgi:hypothetical protein